MNPDIARPVEGVTGHLTIAAAEWEPIRLRVREFLARLHREFPHLPRVLLSALAHCVQQTGQGTDQAPPLHAHLFTEARGALDRAAGADERRDLLCLLGETALTEQVEWAPIHRQRPREHDSRVGSGAQAFQRAAREVDASIDRQTGRRMCAIVYRPARPRLQCSRSARISAAADGRGIRDIDQ